MAKFTEIELTPDDPIFSEGPTSFVPWSPKSTPASQNDTAGATQASSDLQPETETDGKLAWERRHCRSLQASKGQPVQTPVLSKRKAQIDLRAAYLATDFVFEVEGQQYTLHVGEQNTSVRDLLATHCTQGAAFITAYNPISLPLGAVHNTLAMEALKRDLKANPREPWTIYEGAGQDRAGVWPPEPSLMVLGIDRAEAEALGRRYGQYAIVWVDATGVPSLVELADLDQASRYPLTEGETK